MTEVSQDHAFHATQTKAAKKLVNLRPGPLLAKEWQLS